MKNVSVYCRSGKDRNKSAACFGIVAVFANQQDGKQRNDKMLSTLGAMPSICASISCWCVSKWHDTQCEHIEHVPHRKLN
ncbi:hypothetical protein O9929_23765 [Vibrio lentus]|nr:hypothetical protein [Vibrio lentus]